MAFTEEVIFAGFGGQGVLSMGRMVAYAGMLKGMNVSWLPSYGPEMRGGTANCNVIVSDGLIGSPVVADADTLIVMNRPSLDKFESWVRPGGKILVNSSLIDIKVTRDDVEAFYYPVNEVAAECGNLKAANMVMLGAYIKHRSFLEENDLLGAFLKVFGEAKKNLLPLNEKAVAAGATLV
ncbi:MAG: 2-oxoacid:acceptor oxidoreductase family protein [Spirochaetales bacterium]|uniref:2-oxoacid:acceptor oxidoreductase family protein n=1 Tax=Candidatus Thalassospirochaeta sargassi TaxID=3119039 RepID=A0AAJ1IDX7_9SPIO|nr:2-oxoacid:acceptor oxidoreductase family protein [Spirochaetales bacterium]